MNHNALLAEFQLADLDELNLMRTIELFEAHEADNATIRTVMASITSRVVRELEQSGSSVH